MNVTDYTYLMNKPDAITEKQTDALGSVLNEFPYFQSARALRLKGLYSQNSFKYNYALKVTAAHTTDRAVLFEFITSETFTSIQNEYYDQKLKDLLEIKVFDSEIVSFEEIKKVNEVRIDPIEQSILNSIREATNVTFEQTPTTFEKPVKIEETKIELIDEQAILDSFKETTPTILAETSKVDEPKIELIDEQAILDSFEEVTPTVLEEPVIEETKIEVIAEELILDSFKEVAKITFEKPSTIEEPKIEIIDEQAILNSFKEVESPTFEEPQKIEEPEVELIAEQPVLIATEEITSTNFEEPLKAEETKTESIDEPVLVTPKKEFGHTFFEEIVDDEEITEVKIPEVRVEPIEKSIVDSIKEATTVIFEEPKIVEEPKEIEVPETVKNAEENLEIGKPLDFSFNEKHSFHEWLQLSRTEPIDRTIEGPQEAEEVKEVKKTAELKVVVEVIDEEKKKKAEIIDKFIETNPKISPIKQTPITPAVQFDLNSDDNSYLMTETLARVYLEQKKYTKAIQAYEILILKYPEKISFFADRISDIKILQQNNNNN
ncbi:hypothetical protein ASF10_20325 [Flavobacterium sp. Leaf82]|uniref:tetratricopeptide repeat protein n=1 Tax=unclassified Flavobacterium TaxID=196869 RepID=UPI0006F3244F|nr:tetratricopeptide repeat protein [Flavobacterium sp. Leaf82]KQO32801.1 hypothetical protein ASF10_20325 [Flavobacterium sp. Leaf82]